MSSYSFDRNRRNQRNSIVNNDDDYSHYGEPLRPLRPTSKSKSTPPETVLDKSESRLLSPEPKQKLSPPARYSIPYTATSASPDGSTTTSFSVPASTSDRLLGNQRASASLLRDDPSTPIGSFSRAPNEDEDKSRERDDDCDNDRDGDKKMGCERFSSTIGIGVGIASLLVLCLGIAMIISSVHTIEEGNAGVYFKYGALVDGVSQPGVNWKAPFVSEVFQVNIRPNTDTLKAIQSISKDGIENFFKEVQVISSVQVDSLIPLIRKFGKEFKQALIFDRIREELRIFCANRTVDQIYSTEFLGIVEIVKTQTELSIQRLGLGGINILNLVIPKPDIPADIANNYKQVKVQWTMQLVAVQQQKTEQIKKETEQLKAVADAERQKAVLRIDNEKRVLAKESDKQLAMLQNEIVQAAIETEADADFYKKQKLAEANRILLTKEYVQLEMARALGNNTKLFFSGQESALGAIFNKVLGEDN